MSLTSIAEVRALVSSRLSDADLAAVITREEAWLANRVGVLSGVRTDTFRPDPGDAPIYLRRRAASVIVTDGGATLVADADYLFTPSTGMIRRLHRAWRSVVTVAYTPTDESAVKRVVIELVRGTVGETGMDAESLGDYSYTRGVRRSRGGLARTLLLTRPAWSMRIRPGWEPRA